jgi:hypothetical protein
MAAQRNSDGLRRISNYVTFKTQTVLGTGPAVRAGLGRTFTKKQMDHGRPQVGRISLVQAVNQLIARGAYREAARIYPDDLIELCAQVPPMVSRGAWLARAGGQILCRRPDYAGGRERPRHAAAIRGAWLGPGGGLARFEHRNAMMPPATCTLPKWMWACWTAVAMPA